MFLWGILLGVRFEGHCQDDQHVSPKSFEVDLQGVLPSANLQIQRDAPHLPAHDAADAPGTGPGAAVPGVGGEGMLPCSGRNKSDRVGGTF